MFNKKKIIDFSSLLWSDMKYRKTPKCNFLDYERNVMHGPTYFDRMRFCELETSIHIWKNESLLTKREVVEEVYKLFTPCFKILSFSYEFSKFYSFKVKLEGCKKGVIKSNKYLHFEIELKESKECITNETQSLGVLNNSNRRVELRKGQTILFYFTDLYG